MTNTEKYIHTFIDLFTSRTNEVLEITETDRGNVLKKILFATLLDALNKTASRCANVKPNLTQFIINYTSWDSATKISLPHFMAALHQEPLIDTSDSQVATLIGEVDRLYAAWTSTIDHPFHSPEALRLVALRDNDQTQLHALSIDNDIDEGWIETFCPLTKLQSIDKWFQHAAMLKKFRNCLVHESRQMGANNRPERFDVPHYEHICCGDRKTGQMELYFNLVYPCDFIYRLVTTAIERVKLELINMNYNPFESWPKREIYWVTELNETLLLPRY